jgi:hypothetical protein
VRRLCSRYPCSTIARISTNRQHDKTAQSITHQDSSSCEQFSVNCNTRNQNDRTNVFAIAWRFAPNIFGSAYAHSISEGTTRGSVRCFVIGHFVPKAPQLTAVPLPLLKRINTQHAQQYHTTPLHHIDPNTSASQHTSYTHQNGPCGYKSVMNICVSLGFHCRTAIAMKALKKSSESWKKLANVSRWLNRTLWVTHSAQTSSPADCTCVYRCDSVMVIVITDT